jgi:hypothetical protein
MRRLRRLLKRLNSPFFRQMPQVASTRLGKMKAKGEREGLSDEAAYLSSRMRGK